MKSDKVNHPAHYGGENNPYEAIKIIDACGLDFCTGNAIKYILRAGKKDGATEQEDLLKAVWYLEHKAGVAKIESTTGTIVPAGATIENDALREYTVADYHRFRAAVEEIDGILAEYYASHYSFEVTASNTALRDICDILRKHGITPKERPRA